MTDETDDHRPAPRVPLLPILWDVTIFYVWFLDVVVLLGHWASDGKWPSPLKFWVITGIAVVMTACKMTLFRKHRFFDRVRSDVPLDGFEMAAIVCLFVVWGLLFAWLAAGPPGPEFRPVGF